MWSLPHLVKGSAGVEVVPPPLPSWLRFSDVLVGSPEVTKLVRVRNEGPIGALVNWTVREPDDSGPDDRLVEVGRCTRVVRTDIPGKEGDRKKDVLYAPLAGERASDAMRELWHKVKVPKGKELQDTLVSRKVRTEDELQVPSASHHLP